MTLDMKVGMKYTRKEILKIGEETKSKNAPVEIAQGYAFARLMMNQMEDGARMVLFVIGPIGSPTTNFIENAMCFQKDWIQCKTIKVSNCDGGQEKELADFLFGAQIRPRVAFVEIAVTHDKGVAAYENELAADCQTMIIEFVLPPRMSASAKRLPNCTLNLDRRVGTMLLRVLIPDI